MGYLFLPTTVPTGFTYWPRRSATGPARLGRATTRLHGGILCICESVCGSCDSICGLSNNAVDEIKILKCPDNLSEHNQFCSAILDC